MVRKIEPIYEIREPSPESLSESLRSVGYSLATAMADLLDNSVSAKAKNVWLDFHWDGEDSVIAISDDGTGMSEKVLSQAMRPGSTSPAETRRAHDLGRFGLGLKTASFSQCRRLEVWAKEKSGGTAGRIWDLDYVVKKKEWRLIVPETTPDIPQITDLEERGSGVVVVWKKLDRLIGPSHRNSRFDHERFLNAIESVRRHLGMIFHRFLDGTAYGMKSKLAIWINGQSPGSRVEPWSPFQIPGAPPSKETPVETIKASTGTVHVQGFVLPHKDRLNEEQYSIGAGPGGWLSHQGFYIYRANRIIVPGDWLRLGRPRPWGKEEHYKLARLSLDIPNDSDDRWSLDIKKSTARPPGEVQYRLTDLAEQVRRDARQVFVHRGARGGRQVAPAPVMTRPWLSESPTGKTHYRINRNHPVIAEVIAQLGPLSNKLNPLFRLLEETVPVQRIWLDVAESADTISSPYSEAADEAIISDLRIACAHLKRTLKKREANRISLMGIEPFGDYPDLIVEALSMEFDS
jgi:hypothetical protein